MRKLKLQYFGHLMGRTDSLGKILMLGKIEGRRRSGGQSMRLLGGISNSMDMSLSELWEMVKDRKAQSQTQLSDEQQQIMNDAERLFMFIIHLFVIFVVISV